MTADATEAREQPAIGVFLCEDDPRLRAQLGKLLRSTPRLVVVGEAGSAEEALTSLAAAGPDVLLLDLELPGLSGLDLLERLPPPPDGPEVLILTTFADAEVVFRAVRLGAAGYLVKGSPRERLLRAIDQVAHGGTVIEPRLARRFWNLFQASRGQQTHEDFGLTAEEVDVLALVAKGLTNPEVGQTLGTSRRRVKTRLAAIYRKLAVSGRVEAVIKATTAGLIDV